jgi:mono/diheme cytochrome c family protein
VHVAEGGRVYAFVYGVGFLAGEEPGLGWQVRSAAFGDRYLLHLAADPNDPDRLHAVADTGTVLTSKDGGRSWASYTGHDRETAEVVAEGGRLYDEVCKSCHGAKGVGERPEDMYASDDYGVVAPPLDDTAHGWHHSDRNLAETILNGSPRNPRMMPFKEIISEQDAANLVAYLKSLWSPRNLACQGARHMRCAH